MRQQRSNTICLSRDTLQYPFIMKPVSLLKPWLIHSVMPDDTQSHGMARICHQVCILFECKQVILE